MSEHRSTKDLLALRTFEAIGKSQATCARKFIESKRMITDCWSPTVQRNLRKNRHRVASLCLAVPAAVDLAVGHHFWIRRSSDGPWLRWQTCLDASRKHQDWVYPRERHEDRHELVHSLCCFYPKRHSPPAAPVSSESIGFAWFRWWTSLSQAGG